MRFSDRFTAMAWQRGIVAVVIAALVWVFVPATSAQAAPGTSVELKVLLLSDGQAWSQAFADLMDQEGVPYTTVNIAGAHSAITASFLADSATGRGHFQAVILPDQYGTGLSAAEFAAIKSYEQQFGVRQVNMVPFPDANTGQAAPWSGVLDGAAATVTSAGLAGPFTYLNGSFTIDNYDTTQDEVYGHLAGQGTLAAGATFTPLITATIGGHTGALVSIYTHDYREELSIAAAYNGDQEWFTEIGHGVLTWATRGIHLGYHRNYFAVHVDDIFLSDGRWSATAHCTPGDSPTCTANTIDIRMVSSDVDRLTTWQTTNNFKLDMLFNGYGSDSRPGDALTTKFMTVKSQFRWVNHTYSHPYLGCLQFATPAAADPWRCATPADAAAADHTAFYDEDLIPDGVNVDGTLWLSEAKILSEITQNQAWATSHGLTNFDPAALVTGEHSGLATTPEQPADSPYLAGALASAGITFTGSDASRETGSRLLADGTTRTLPRHPMNIFYNAGRYTDEVSEYNWIYTSAANGGSGICGTSASSCITPLANTSNTVAQASFNSYILPIEVRNAYSKVIAGDPRPFYAHQSNLAEDGILYPVLNGVLAKYRATYDSAKSPIVNDDMVSLGDALNAMTDWASADAGVSAYIDAAGVHVSGPSGTSVPLTVPADTTVTGLSAYDGELSGWIAAPTTDTVVAVPALAMGGYVGHTPPDAPTAVTATQSTQFLDWVDVAWTAPAVDGGAPITGYNLRESTDGGTTWTTIRAYTTPVTSDVIGGVAAGVDAIFSVQAVNGVGAGPWSAASPSVQRVADAAGVTVSSPDVTYGTASTVTLTVPTTWGFAPSGTATLNVNATAYTQGMVGNTATFSVPGLVPGTYAYTVDYGSDAHIQPLSKSGSLTVTNAAVTATGAVVTVPSPVYGGTYSVTVTPPTGLATPTGGVTVTLTAPSGSVSVNGTLTDGAVTLDLPKLAAGTWDASIVYAGDSNYSSLTTAGSPVTSTKASVAVTGAVSTAPSPQTTGAYAVTVTQAQDLPVPTGSASVTLTLMNGADPVPGVDPVTLPSATLDASGAVTLNVPTLPAGTWAASVAYTGDDNYAQTTSAGATVVSTKATVTSSGAAVASPSPQATGSYAVTVTQPTGLAVATGHVTVTLTGPADPVTVSGDLSEGSVTIALPTLAAGTWAASVAYGGDANYAELTAAGDSVVSTLDNVTLAGAVVSAPSPQDAGSYSISVTQPSGLAVPTGDVTLTIVKGADSRAITRPLVAGAASIPVAALPAGTWVATVAYAGDANYAPGSAGGDAVISTLADVTVSGAVVSTPSPQHGGSYDVTVTQPTGLAVPTGDVTLTLTNGSSTHQDTVTLASGVGTFVLPALAAGTWTASIGYSGDTNYGAPTATGAPVVSLKADVSSLAALVTATPTTTTVGSYSVTVTPPSGLAPATGDVTVTLTSGADTKTGTGTLSGGVATVSVPRLPVGTWTASVSYAGDAYYNATAASAPSVVSVKGSVQGVVTSVTKRPTPTKTGTYKVTVTPASGAATPTGTVTVTLTKGTTTKKIYGTLSSGTVSITVPKLPSGVWRASVRYVGDATYLTKSSTAAFVIVGKTKVSTISTAVTKVPTTTATGTYAMAVGHYTGLPTPTGTVAVTLKKGSTTKKVYGTLSAGGALFTIPKLPKGTWSVTASYAGNSIYWSTSATGKSIVVTQ